MSNFSLEAKALNYQSFTRLQQQGLLLSQGRRLPLVNGAAQQKPVLEPAQEKALNQIKSGTQRLLGSGIVGDDLQRVSRHSQMLERSLKLGRGEIKAANIKAALDLGQELVADEAIREGLGQIESPFTAVISVQGLQRSIQDVGENPNPHNLKRLMSSTRGVATSVGEISALVIEHAPELGGEVAKVFARGSSQFMGRIGPALNLGIATMDVALAGQDIYDFWRRPNLKNLAHMSLGTIAASASVLKVAVPALQTPATVVATLADLGKLGLDLDWKAAGQGLGLVD